jgi:hypothetical protein
MNRYLDTFAKIIRELHENHCDIDAGIDPSQLNKERREVPIPADDAVGSLLRSGLPTELQPFERVLSKAGNVIMRLYPANGASEVNIGSYARYHAGQWLASRRPSALQELRLALEAWERYVAKLLNGTGTAERATLEGTSYHSIFSPASLEKHRLLEEKQNREREAHDAWLAASLIRQVARRQEALVQWPTLCDAILTDDIPMVPFLVGNDGEGLRWETGDLRQYARYAFRSYVYSDDGGPGIGPEPHERAMFRMRLVEDAILHLASERRN